MSTAQRPLHQRGPPGEFRVTARALALLVLAAILIALLVHGIVKSSNSPPGTGSGVAATQARSLPPFRGVAAAGAINVIVHVGSRQSVSGPRR
jgi:hypothetical protein